MHTLNHVMIKEKLRSSFERKLHQRVADQLEVPLTDLEFFLRRATPGVHSPELAPLASRFTDRARLCRPELSERAATQWLRRHHLIPGRELSWDRLVLLTRGLNCEVVDLFK